MSRHYWLNLSCCSCRHGRNGVVVFSLIVILSTLHNGCARDDCLTFNKKCTGVGRSNWTIGYTCTGHHVLRCKPSQTVGNNCNQTSQNCCNGYTCNNKNKCVTCYLGRSCKKDANCQMTGCLPGMVCDTTTDKCICSNSTQMGGGCCSDSDCSKGLMCNEETHQCYSRGESETCEPCVTYHGKCRDSSTHCCKPLTCRGGKCQHCRGLYDSGCTKDQDCCNGYRCNKNGVCVPCGCGVGRHDGRWCEGTACEDLSCQYGKCLPCIKGEGSACGHNDLPCCIGLSDSNLTCFKETCQNCTKKSSPCGEDSPDCCTETCLNETCQDCCGLGDECSTMTKSCCNSTYWIYNISSSQSTECLTVGIKCNTSNDLCCRSQGLTCSAVERLDDSTFYVNKNGALSLFNMNFSLKQLVGFAVVMVATGILWIDSAWMIQVLCIVCKWFTVGVVFAVTWLNVMVGTSQVHTMKQKNAERLQFQKQ